MFRLLTALVLLVTVAPAQQATKAEARAAMERMYKLRKEAFDRGTELRMRGLLSEADSARLKQLLKRSFEIDDRWTRAVTAQRWANAIELSRDMDRNSAEYQKRLDVVEARETQRRDLFKWTVAECDRLLARISADGKEHNSELFASGNAADARAARMLEPARHTALRARKLAASGDGGVRSLAWRAVDQWAKWRKTIGLPAIVWGKPEKRRRDEDEEFPDVPNYSTDWERARYFLSLADDLEKELSGIAGRHDLTSVLDRRAARGRIIIHVWTLGNMEIPPQAMVYWRRLMEAVLKYKRALGEPPRSEAAKRLWLAAEVARASVAQAKQDLKAVERIVLLRRRGTRSDPRWSKSHEIEAKVKARLANEGAPSRRSKQRETESPSSGNAEKPKAKTTLNPNK